MKVKPRDKRENLQQCASYFPGAKNNTNHENSVLLYVFLSPLTKYLSLLFLTDANDLKYTSRIRARVEVLANQSQVNKEQQIIGQLKLLF